MNRESKEQIIKEAMYEYVNASIENKSLTKISEKYGITRGVLTNRLRKAGYEIINYQNRVRFNENIFDSIDTEEKAYWLGFIFADGNISSTGNRLEIRLSYTDLAHLEKFRKFIGLTTEIRCGISKEGYKWCHLSVRNKHIWNILNNYGCVPRKSLIVEFPKITIFNNTDLVIDFIRGYVDGNGSLMILNKEGYPETRLTIVSTEKFLKSVNKIFLNSGKIRYQSTINYSNNSYELRFSQIRSRIVARILYSHASMYLDRKYDKYKKFCLLEEKSSKMKSSRFGESWKANTKVHDSITKAINTLQSIDSE